MASIDTENSYQIRDGIEVTITVNGTSYVPILGTWTETTDTDYAGTLTHSGTISSGLITLRANDNTDYVVCDGETYYPNPSGLVIITTPDTTIYFYGDGAAPYSTSVPVLNNGFSCTLDNRSITTLNLALRANINLVNPSWETSEINLSFILPKTDETALQYIATHISGANIYYSASYGDSTDHDDSLRVFTCTTEGLEVAEREVTLTGVDQGGLLSETAVPRYFSYDEDAGFERLYALFRSFLTGAGVANITYEAAPEVYDIGTDLTDPVYLDEGTYAERILFFMRHMLIYDVDTSLSIWGEFWPRYVDAGRPKVTWTKPESKWTINEAECGDVRFFYAPDIKSLTIDNDSVSSEGSRETIETKAVKNGHKYAFDLQTPYRSFTVTNANIIKSNPMRVVVRATATGDAVLKGIPIEFYDFDASDTNPKTVSINTYGQELKVDGSWHFEAACATDRYGNQIVFYDYYTLYKEGGNTQTVQFRWKGDPRMQPLDVFTFRRLDGTSETWTIGSITLDHTSGGLTAEITARKGVI